MDLQTQLNRAWELKKNGQFVESLKLYQGVHDFLVDEAGNHTRTIPDTRVDEGTTTKIMPSLFSEIEKYLRRDNVFCTVLNNMGVIYAESGDLESAKQCFEDSIKFTPNGMNYPDPKIALETFKK